MSIKLEQAIIHVLDASGVVPLLSDIPLSMNEEFQTYLLKTIKKTFQSDDIKTCFFLPESDIWNQCMNLSWDIISISKNIATDIFNVMRRNKDIPSADVLFGMMEINSDKYFYMLKFNYKSAFTHFVQKKEKQVFVNTIKHQALFPIQAPTISEGFFINIENPVVKVLERKFTIDGIKDYYLSSKILCCTENKSPRQKTTELLKTAENIADIYYRSEDEMDAHISSIMYEEFQKGQTLSVDQLGKQFFSQNPAAQKDFFARLAVQDISKEEKLTLSEKFQKKFEKQSIKTAHGVEIKIPMQLYSDPNEIEFINNPDGTVSLLIKNIKI